jgi:hypothetical protein
LQATSNKKTMKTITIEPGASRGLYEQLEETISDRNKLYFAARMADEYLCKVSKATAVEQEDVVSRLNADLLGKLDLENPATHPTAMLCVAMIECKRALQTMERGFTASEMVLLAIENLSAKYHADW